MQQFKLPQLALALPPALQELTIGKRDLNPDQFKRLLQTRSKIDGPLMIIYVRHGRSAGNERDTVAGLGAEHQALKDHYAKFEDHDFPLVSVGREQARSAGRTLAHLWHTGIIPGIDRTFCSPFTRTKETLVEMVHGVREYCADHALNPESVLKGSVELLALIGERYWHNFGDLTKEQQDLEYEKRVQNPLFWIPGTAGEQMQEVYNRGRDFAAKVHRPQFKGKVILAPTHGEFMNGSELGFLEIDPFSKEFSERFDTGIPNCGIYIFSKVPISGAMHVQDARSISGFDYFLKVAPYELEGKDREKFAEWGGEPVWQKRENRRIEIGEFPEQMALSEESRELAQAIEKAGVGAKQIKPRF